MKYRKVSMLPYNIHFINTEKFKTITVSVFFRRPINKNELTIRKLLQLILINSCKKYPTKYDFEIIHEDLYGLYTSTDSSLTGNHIETRFLIKILEDKYTEEGNFFKCLELLCEMLFNPNSENGQFNIEEFNTVKSVLKEELETKKENKSAYSIKTMLNKLDETMPISMDSTGYLEDLDVITENSLFEYYKSMLNSDLVDIFVLGNTDNDAVKNLLIDKVKINTFKKENKPEVFKHNTSRYRLQKFFEEDDINQSKFSLGIKTCKLTEFERKYVMILYNIIFGGDTESRLFRIVREKHSLVYFIRSYYRADNNIIYIACGIDNNNIDKTLKIIKNCMKDLAKEIIDDEDLNKAKKIYTNSLETFYDSPSSIINFYYGMNILKTDDIETRKQMIEKVTVYDIKKAAKKVFLDTLFVLKGVKTNEND